MKGKRRRRRREKKNLEKIIALIKLNRGYTLIDTADAYLNEASIGDVLVNGKRSHVFLISKVWPTELGFQETLDVIDSSLTK